MTWELSLKVKTETRQVDITQDHSCRFNCCVKNESTHSNPASHRKIFLLDVFTSFSFIELEKSIAKMTCVLSGFVVKSVSFCPGHISLAFVPQLPMFALLPEVSSSFISRLVVSLSADPRELLDSSPTLFSTVVILSTFLLVESLRLGASFKWRGFSVISTPTLSLLVWRDLLPWLDAHVPKYRLIVPVLFFKQYFRLGLSLEARLF